ncbi:hypothetical protein VKT23_013210 [Stygiomarasmius scandens]|uniref:F-box domain-containing protein n=1 Tax=Marasmiellus scandens TaxID=2682957 RepID=A0ABR1J6H8_9AGAR
MKRTSSRLQKQAHVSYAHSSESESKEPVPQSPPKKKRKTANRRPRTVANARQRRIERYREALLQIPMELWFEILSYLEPNDMLALSRTSKDFRAVLMDKSSIKLWKTAFLNAPDVPKPLPGFSEPQHASLLFDNHCQVSPPLVSSMRGLKYCSLELFSVQRRFPDDDEVL